MQPPDPDDRDIQIVVAAPPRGAAPDGLVDIARDVLKPDGGFAISEELVLLAARILLGFALKCVEDRVKAKLDRAAANPLYRARLTRQLGRSLPDDFGDRAGRDAVAGRMIDRVRASVGTPAWTAAFARR